MRKTDQIDRMKKTYETYYQRSYSFRKNWFGKITESYIIPKYFSLLEQFIGNTIIPITLLELGAGDGEITEIITNKRPNWYMVPTEYTMAGVNSLRKHGFSNAKVVDAVHLPFKDRSFDYVVSFDVMHHVNGPAKMAYEMIRVAKKGAFLIEANRQSIFRRILEKTDIYRRAGEFSYYPIEYKAFFTLPDVSTITITPFQFIPPKLSNISLNFTIGLSETIAKLPLLKWQCSGLAIEVIKTNTSYKT